MGTLVTKNLVVLCLTLTSLVAQANWTLITGDERVDILRALSASVQLKNNRINNCEISSQRLINKQSKESTPISTEYLYIDASGAQLLAASMSIDGPHLSGYSFNRTTIVLNNAGTEVIDMIGTELQAVSRNTGTITKPRWIVELKETKRVTCN